MFANKAEFWLFIDWLLLGVAARPQSDKTPGPISGLWVTYNQRDPKKRGKNGVRTGPAYMRGSDLAMRRYVAIRAMRDYGQLNLKEACIEVVNRLGRTTEGELEGELNSIRSGFEKYEHPFREELIAQEVGSFKFWMAWEIGFNFQVNSVPIEDLVNLTRKDVLSRGCTDREASRIAEKWKELAQRALSIAKDVPARE